MDAGLSSPAEARSGIAARFRGFLPVVVDVETSGLDARTDALLEIAAVIIAQDDAGLLYRAATHAAHVQPFAGARMDPKALEFNGIDPHQALRGALPEDEALRQVFQPIRQAVRDSGCTRAVLVGHNAFFDLGFVNAAVARAGIKRNPFHPFASFDTATLAALVFGQTVLAKAMQAAGLAFDAKEAHSAIYDAERTADLFCLMVNEWTRRAGLLGLPMIGLEAPNAAGPG